jgi:succinoglycan biosynthesis protein ExoM
MLHVNRKALMVDSNVNSGALSIDVCVCTYRRKSLAATMASLFRLELKSEWRVRLIIADNDETPSARTVVETAERNAPFPVLYVHAPSRNISVARNACLNAATAKFVAFIDDDECASRDWLAALIGRQAESRADVVLGPVRSCYPPQSPAWLRIGDFHSIEPVWVKGKILQGYTSNVLFIREAAALRNLRFDPKLGRTGGEDTIFFAAVQKAGGQLDYAPDAVVTEDVAAERLNLPWLARRFFRSGQTHGMLLLSDQGQTFKQRLRHFALASAKGVYCLSAAVVCMLSGGPARFWFLRGALHAGVVARLLGLSALIQYG